ncbi:unnamed protein product [Amaranthus hypochondriacus]
MEVTKNIELQTSEPTRDTYKIAYILHFFLGAGNLLPWNAFITAIDYFAYLYPSKHVERVFSVAYMTSSLLILLLLVKRQGKSNSMLKNKASFRVRMNVGFSMFVLSLMVAPIIDWAKWPAMKSHGSFIMTVCSVIVCGLSDGLIGGSLIGSAGNLPKEYMQAVFAGTASSGVLVTMLRMLTKASLPEDPQGLQTSAHFYFIVTAIILVVCTICSNLLFTLPVMQAYYKKQQSEQQHTDTQTYRPKLFETARKILLPALGILIIYVVTLSIFPGFISDNDQKSELLKDWYPILLIMAYNVSDLAGKSLTALLIPSNINKVTWACLGRVLFYPAFRVCLHGPKWLDSEVPTVLLTFMLGLSNGYLTSTLMILTPKSVSASEAETAAVVMAVALGFGLVGGSVLGWLWII